jgi:hypothetical protein
MAPLGQQKEMSPQTMTCPGQIAAAFEAFGRLEANAAARAKLRTRSFLVITSPPEKYSG